MNRSIQISVALFACLGVAWLTLLGGNYGNGTLAQSRRLRGDSADERGITESERDSAKDMGMTKKDIKHIEDAIGEKQTKQFLHALKHLNNTSAGKPKDTSGQYILTQIICGILFYCLVASKFPDLVEQNSESKQIMEESTICRIKLGASCLQACCFPAAMLAKVMKSTQVANYWVALVLAACFPCCTIFASVQCCDMDKKLGLGTAKGFVCNAFEACCCSWCLIAQTTDALDAATGWQTGCCTASKSGPAYGQVG